MHKEVRMKTLVILAVVALFVGIVFCCDASASVDDKIIQTQMASHPARIGQGIKMCQVTPAENEELLREQRRMEKMWEKKQSDSALTEGEQSRIRQRLNNSNRYIYRQRNAGQKGRR
jgi:hypothetical protein